MQIGQTIKRLRLENNMTQVPLAEALNLSTQAVSKWKTSLSLPDLTFLPALANLFEVSADTPLGIDLATKKSTRSENSNTRETASVQWISRQSLRISRGGLGGISREFPPSKRADGLPLEAARRRNRGETGRNDA